MLYNITKFMKICSTVMKLFSEKMYILPALKTFGCMLLLMMFRISLCDFTGILYQAHLYLQNYAVLCISMIIILFIVNWSWNYTYILELESSSYIFSCICKLWSINLWPCRLKQNIWINWPTINAMYLVVSKLFSNCIAISNEINIF